MNEVNFERRRAEIRQKAKTQSEYDRLSDEERETVGSRARVRNIRHTTHNRLKSEAREALFDWCNNGSGRRFDLTPLFVETERESPLVLVVTKDIIKNDWRDEPPKDSSDNILCLKYEKRQNTQVEFEDIDEALSVVTLVQCELDTDNIELERREHASAMVQKKTNKKKQPMRFGLRSVLVALHCS